MANSVTRIAALAAAALVISAAPALLSAQQAVKEPVVRDLSHDLGCSPQAAVLPPAPSMWLLGGQQPKRRVFGKGDGVIVSGGSARGVRVGQDYFVRRVVHDEYALPVAGFVPVAIHTAGWVRVVEVDTDMAIGRVLESCDGMIEGDYLEPYVRLAMPRAMAAGEPDYAAAGVIVLADERRQMGSAGSTMVLDRGLGQGVRPGQRGTVFRNALDGGGPVVRIGEATAVIVGQETSVIRIDSSRDAVMVGDRVALHK